MGVISCFSGGGISINGTLKTGTVVDNNSINSGDFITEISPYESYGEITLDSDVASTEFIKNLNAGSYQIAAYNDNYNIKLHLLGITSGMPVFQDPITFSDYSSTQQWDVCFNNNTGFGAVCFGDPSGNLKVGTFKLNINTLELIATNTVVSDSYAGHFVGCICLENNVLIVHSKNQTNRNLWGTIVSLPSSSTGTAQVINTKAISNVNYSGINRPHATQIYNTYYLVGYRQSQSGGSSCALLNVVNDTDFNVVTTQDFDSSGVISGIASRNNQSAIVYYLENFSSQRLISRTVSTDGSSLTINSASIVDNGNTFFSTSSIFSPTLFYNNTNYVTYVSNNGVLLKAGSSSRNLTLNYNSGCIGFSSTGNNGFLFTGKTGNAIVSSIIYTSPSIAKYNGSSPGIAKTSGNTGENISYYVPNI